MQFGLFILVLGLAGLTLSCSQQAEHQCDTWVKLNTHPVCFYAKGNRPGSFAPSLHGFLKAVKLKHLSGFVSCVSNTRKHDSNWGCKARSSVINEPLNVFVTNKDNEVMFPQTGMTYNARYGKTSKFYALKGFDDMSPELVLQHGCTIPSDYIGADSLLRVWYGEDLFNVNEGDNSGKACVDVYGKFF